MTNYLWADLHLSHARILEYCRRPDANVEEMNERLIDAWNSVVTKRDRGFLLGDVGMGTYDEIMSLLLRMNGMNTIIPGGHDKQWLKHWQSGGPSNWRLEQPIYHLHYQHPEKGYAVLCHYPLRSWHGSVHGVKHFYGHVHGTQQKYPNCLDVGCDVFDKPIALEEALSLT